MSRSASLVSCFAGAATSLSRYSGCSPLAQSICASHPDLAMCCSWRTARGDVNTAPGCGFTQQRRSAVPPMSSNAGGATASRCGGVRCACDNGTIPRSLSRPKCNGTSLNPAVSHSLTKSTCDVSGVKKRWLSKAMWMYGLMGSELSHYVRREAVRTLMRWTQVQVAQVKRNSATAST